MAEEEDEGPKPNKANPEDEFLRHPHSGAFIRNPLLDKSRSSPILFQEPEFRHNCLEEALADYNCITVTEASFKEMLRHGAALANSAATTATTGTVAGGGTNCSPLARAALSTLTRTSKDYEFVVNIKKSTYVPPRAGRRRADQKTGNGTVVDKLNIEVADDRAGGLRVEDVKEGLIAVWNRRQHPVFQVRSGDRVIKANQIDSSKASPMQLQEEMEQATDVLRLVLRRPGMMRAGSKSSTGSHRFGETF